MRKLFWGLFFITAGAFIILDHVYSFTNIRLISLLLTIFLVAVFLKSLFKLKFGGMLFSLAFLCIIYSEPLNLENITPWPVLLTALLGTIGLSILFNKHCFYKKGCFSKYHRNDFSEVVNNEDGDKVNFSVNFGSSIKYINSEDFKIANLKCSFGGMKVYFDNAKIIGETATVNLDVSFSGVELYIPKDWKIINKADISLGAIEEKNSGDSKAKKTIVLTGKVSLSGVEIMYI